MQGSKAAPKSIKEYSSTDLNISLKGIKFECTANNTTINDLQITDDCLVDGAVFIVLNSLLGDKISCQVIDKDNILGYGANTVLGEYVTDWYINPEATEQLNYKSEYPAKIYSGLYLRIIYTSAGTPTSMTTVIVNYKLHKLLW